MKRSTWFLALFMLMAAALVACGSPAAPTDPGTTGSVVAVSIDQEDQTLELGDSVPLSVTVDVTGDASDAVTWSSDDDAVASVSDAGVVEALALGVAVITATSDADASKSDSITVSVGPGAGPFELTVTPSAAVPGTTVTLSFPEFIDSPSVTFDGVAADVVSVTTSSTGTFPLTTLDVVVPGGVIGFPTIVVDDGDRRAVLDGDALAFFAGADATGAPTVAAVQDALDAVPEGSAVLLGDVTINDGGSLVIDNRVLFGAPDGDTILAGVADLRLLVRGENTAGIVGLTLTTDDVSFYSGRINPDAIGVLSWPPSFDEPIETTSQGRFLIQDAVLTGTSVTEPTVDPTTLAISTYGEASGEMSTPATIAAYEFRSATVRFGSIDMDDTTAIGSWTFVDSDVWAQNRFRIRQETGEVRVTGSRIMLAGDPTGFLDDLEIDIDGFVSDVSDSGFSSTRGIDFDHDDGGDRTITDSLFRAETRLRFRGDYLGDITVLDSTFVALDGRVDFETDGGRIHMERTVIDANQRIRVRVDYAGHITIVDADWVSRTDDVDVYVDYAGDIDIRDSVLRAADRVRVESDDVGSVSIVNSTFIADRVGVEAEIGHVRLERVTIDADGNVDLEVGDAGDLLLRDVTIDAGGTIDFYNDYLGSIRVEKSQLRAGRNIEIEPWSGGVTQVTILDTTLQAVEDVVFTATNGGDTRLDGATIESQSGAIRVDQGGGTLTIAASSLTTLGEAHPTDVLWTSDHEIEVASRKNVTTVAGTSIEAAGPVRMINEDERPPFDGGAGANDIVLKDNPSIQATGDIEVTSYADLIVTGNASIASDGAITLTARYGLIDTTDSVFTPAPVIDGATVVP